MQVLTDEDLRFWDDNGYVIVHDAVPRENVAATVAAIWQFLRMDPADPETWYRTDARANDMPELNAAGMIEMYQHQALWDNRQAPRIYGAFADLWGTRKLWVTIDRANMNPPARPSRDFRGFIHWDIDTGIDPLPFAVQGLLSLSDTPENGGGLQCVPGFVKRFPEWVKTQPPDRDTWHPDLTGLAVKSIAMAAGDLVIWHSGLPHGTGRNTSDRPRLAQYISMFPAREDDEAERRERVRMWRDRAPRTGAAFPGDPRQWEQKHGTTAQLTPLGRTLLGLDSWEAEGAPEG